MKANTPVEPFRFLDLPKEIRLMVYERLPRKIKHHQFRHPDEPAHRVTFILKSFPVALLATCSTIRQEAQLILNKTLKNFILDSPPRILDGVGGRGDGRMLAAIMRAVVKQHGTLEDQELGSGSCLKLPQVFEGRLRTALQSKRTGRFIVKFIHQAGHQLRYGDPKNQARCPDRISDLRLVELVKYTSEISGIGQHWALGADLHALNNRLHREGIAVMCAGVLHSSAKASTSCASISTRVPQHVDFEAYGLGCYIPSKGQMKEEAWLDGWLE